MKSLESSNILDSSISEISDSSDILDPAVSVDAVQVLDASKSFVVSIPVNIVESDSSVVLHTSEVLDTSQSSKITDSPQSDSTDSA